MLYELLTGAPPFVSPSALELGQKHRDEKPAPLRLVRSDIPRTWPGWSSGSSASAPRTGPPTPWRSATRCSPSPTAGRRRDGRGLGALRPGPLPHVRQARAAMAPVLEKARPAAGSVMDVFGLHRQLIKDYREFTEGGTIIRDDRVAAFVESDLDAKSQWPDPWVSLNPFFASGGTVSELSGDGKLLHEECARIFQAGKTRKGTKCDGRPLTLHRHQFEAIQAAKWRESYVLTTGTGSGKSLSYIVPIVDRVLRARDHVGQARPGDHRLPDERTGQQPGQRAGEVPAGRLRRGPRAGHVRPLHRPGGRRAPPGDPRRPAGHPADQLRDAGADAHPPEGPRLADPDGEGPGVPGLRRAAHLPGPPGRRRRAAHPAGPGGVPGGEPECIGTSATMSSEGTFEDQKKEVARVATTLFGTKVDKDNVIGETLVRATAEAPPRCRRSGCAPPPPPRLRRPGEGSAGPLDRDAVRSRRGSGGTARPAAAREDRGGRRRPREGVRRPGGRLRSGDPPHAGGRFGGPALGDRAPAVRVPAAPVPVQGRHGLRHPGGPVVA